MKQVILKSSVIAGIALLTVPVSVFAQKNKDKIETDKTSNKEIQTIVITRKANADGKTIVEINGDKVKINGKDPKNDKDVSVQINTIKRNGVYSFRGEPGSDNFNFNWNDEQGPFSIFSEDANRAMLGVVTDENEKGAEIVSVTKESAAEKAGLKKGDIITKIGDKKIENSDEVTKAVRAYKPGDKISINFLRDGKEEKATAELTKWKGIQMNAISVPRIQMEKMRVQMNKMGEQMHGLKNQWREMPPPFTFNAPGFGKPRLGLSVQDTEDGAGVKVLDVDEESAAAKAGIKKDDIILGVDDTNIKGTDDLINATRGDKNKTSYHFKVKRGNSTQTIEVKVPRKLKTAEL